MTRQKKQAYEHMSSQQKRRKVNLGHQVLRIEVSLNFALIFEVNFLICFVILNNFRSQKSR